jgi:hypothetical protein
MPLGLPPGAPFKPAVGLSGISNSSITNNCHPERSRIAAQSKNLRFFYFLKGHGFSRAIKTLGRKRLQPRRPKESECRIQNIPWDHGSNRSNNCHSPKQVSC